MTQSTRRRAAFTMMELLIVVLIILILMGMTFGVMNMILRQRKKVETKGMLDHISLAMTQYLDPYPILGLTCDVGSSDFVNSPWTFLCRNYVALGKDPLLTMKKANLASGAAAGPWAGADAATADQILDAFIVADHSNRFIWAIVNGKGSGSATYNYTDQIWIRSTAGTPTNPKDDLIIRWKLKDGQWTQLKYDDAMADPDLPPSFGL